MRIVTNCYAMLFRAELSAQLYRESVEAKAALKARRQHETEVATATINSLQKTVINYRKNKQSVQQYRHETNRAMAQVEEAFAEARRLETKNEELQRLAEKMKNK